MIHTTRKLIQQYRQFLVYSIIGGMGATIDFVLFSVLVHYGIYTYLVANVISTSAGIVNNFGWNTLLNFKVRDKLLRRFVSFYVIGCVGLAASSGLLYVMVQWLSLNTLVSKLLTIIVVVLLQYNLNKRISFKSQPLVE